MSQRFNTDDFIVPFHCCSSLIPEFIVPNCSYQFQLGKIIGHGSYGSVFQMSNSQYVIKIIWENSSHRFQTPNESIEYSFWEMVHQVVQTPNSWPSHWAEVFVVGYITKTIQLDKRTYNSGSPILIMPLYLHWNDIFQNMPQSLKRNPARLFYVWKILLFAMCHLQQKWNFVHLDLKLGNILFDTSGNIRIIDFGLIEPLGITNQMSLLFPMFNEKYVKTLAKESTEILNYHKPFPVLHRNIIRELYYIWPPSPCSLRGLMTYSLVICQFEMVYDNNVYKFQGTRWHWAKYLQDLFNRGYPKSWIHLLELCSQGNIEVCYLYQIVEQKFIEENHINPDWKQELDQFIQSAKKIIESKIIYTNGPPISSVVADLSLNNSQTP